MATPALIVDDDGGVRGLLRAVLGRRGIECDFAADGLEALEKLAQKEYCAVVLDLLMPNVDGYSVIAKIAEMQLHIPVIVMTAHVTGGLQDLDVRCVSTVLVKPFNIDQLEDALARTLCAPETLPAAS